MSTGVLDSIIYHLGETCIVEEGTSGIWTYRKWSSGVAECWGNTSVGSTTYNANGGGIQIIESLPPGLFIATPPVVLASGRILGCVHTTLGYTSPNDKNSIQTYLLNRGTSTVTQTGNVYWLVKGRWK